MSIIQNDHSEGPVARAIEKQTAKLPSDFFLWAAVGAVAASVTLKFMQHNKTALFVGQWAAPFLLLGVYNKIVKVEGSNKSDKKNKGQYAHPAATFDEKFTGKHYKGPGQGKHV